MNRRGLLMGVVALAGYVALFLLFPAYDNSATWNYAIGRRSVERVARDIARQWGVDTTGWQFRTRTIVMDDEEYYAWRRKLPELERHSPVHELVLLTHPSKAESVRIRLDASGNPVRIAIRTSLRGAGAIGARQAAREGLRKLGVAVDAYKLSGEESRADGSSRFRWTRRASGAPELTHFAEADVLQGRVTRASRGTQIAGDFRESFYPGSRAFQITQIVIIIGWLLVAVGLLVRSAVQRRLPVKAFVRLWVISSVTLFLLLLTRPTFGENDFESSEDRNGSRVIGVMDLYDPETYLVTLLAIVIGMSWITFWGGGAAAMRTAYPVSAVAFEDFVRGRLSRAQGVAILSGFAFGGLVAATRYLLAASGLFQNVFLSTDPRGLTSPDLTFLYDGYLSVAGVLFAFGFVLPLASSRTRSRALPFVVTVALFAFWTIEGDLSRSFVLEISSRIAVGVILYFLFRRQGLLAVLGAALAANIAVRIAMLFSQPDPGVFGVLVLTGFLTAAGAAFYLARSGPERSTALTDLGSTQTQRERIQEELDLARQAQEKMLPDAAPSVRGFEIEAICRPARQVGGDLFDYRVLRDGRLCIAVADVCGKGVTAALYMTIVKGLFVAATDAEVDPVEIASDINAGLHALHHRNVFVTMFIGVLDADGRRLRFIRAGHNPALWVRGSGREIVALTPPGMALGMTNPNLFRRSLRAEEVTLDPSDVLIVHSDGITEAMNVSREEYGDERLRQSVARAAGSAAAAAATRDAIVTDVAGFVGRAPAHDDLTLVVIRAVA